MEKNKEDEESEEGERKKLYDCDSRDGQNTHSMPYKRWASAIFLFHARLNRLVLCVDFVFVAFSFVLTCNIQRFSSFRILFSIYVLSVAVVAFGFILFFRKLLLLFREVVYLYFEKRVQTVRT